VYCDEKCKKLCAVEKVEDVLGLRVLLLRDSLKPPVARWFSLADINTAVRNAVGTLSVARRLGKDVAECLFKSNACRWWCVSEVVTFSYCQRFYVDLAVSAFCDWLNSPLALWLLEAGDYSAPTARYSVYVALSTAFMRYVDDDGNLSDDGEALLTLNALRGR